MSSPREELQQLVGLLNAHLVDVQRSSLDNQQNMLRLQVALQSRPTERFRQVIESEFDPDLPDVLQHFKELVDCSGRLAKTMKQFSSGCGAAVDEFEATCQSIKEKLG